MGRPKIIRKHQTSPYPSQTTIIWKTMQSTSKQEEDGFLLPGGRARSRETTQQTGKKGEFIGENQRHEKIQGSRNLLQRSKVASSKSGLPRKSKRTRDSRETDSGPVLGLDSIKKLGNREAWQRSGRTNGKEGVSNTSLRRNKRV